jgi:hypothetical protein
MKSEFAGQLSFYPRQEFFLTLPHNMLPTFGEFPKVPRPNINSKARNTFASSATLLTRLLIPNTVTSRPVGSLD